MIWLLALEYPLATPRYCNPACKARIPGGLTGPRECGKGPYDRQVFSLQVVNRGVPLSVSLR
jgi:hypothetical protein